MTLIVNGVSPGSTTTAAGITDATAPARTAITGMTAAGAALSTAADVPAQRTLIRGGAACDMTSAAGITLIPCATPANGTQSVTGGVLRFTLIAASATAWAAGSYTGGAASVAFATDGGRVPVCTRVRYRVAAFTGNASCFIHGLFSDASTNRLGFYLSGNGQLGAFNAVTSATLASTSSGAVPTNGTGWVEVERNALSITVRHGTGVGTAEPTVWTELYTWAVAAGVIFTRYEIAATGQPAPAGGVVWDVDDLTIEIL